MIKSQVLADFILDWTSPQIKEDKVQESFWMISCDDAWGRKGAGASAIITSPSRIKMRYAARLEFDEVTNNVAEYEALLLGLRKIKPRLTQK